jgi:hypothetical protein
MRKAFLTRDKDVLSKLLRMETDNTWRRLEMWDRVRWARRKAQFKSAAAAARALGFDDPETYSAYERADTASKSTRLNMARAQQFATKFKVRWQWLLNDEDNGTPWADEDPGTPHYRRIQKLLDKATPEQQETAADLIEALMKRAVND